MQKGYWADYSKEVIDSLDWDIVLLFSFGNVTTKRVYIRVGRSISEVEN